MKKIILSIAVIASSFIGQSQVVCAGVSPASITGNYTFEWADPEGADWATPDFLITGVFVEDTLMMVEDGTAGLNPQGNPISQEGCGPLTNDLTGKIAVLYRNTCQFGTKALNAQNAGAVGVLIINRDPEAVGMAGGTDGLSVTIPMVMVSSTDGLLLTNEMNNGPVVMFLGNKIGAYNNDIGASADELLISPYGASNTFFDNGFDLGIQIYNFGTSTQQNITVSAFIEGPSGASVYADTVTAPSMLSGDTLSIFNGNTEAFDPFDLGGVGMYPLGEYTLSYTLSLGDTTLDDSDFDNVFSSKFSVNDDMISLANLDAATMPAASSYPSNSTIEYQSCMFFEDPNASAVGILGTYFVPYADTAVDNLEGAEIFINVYEWLDPWTDLTDPNYTTNNAWFSALNQIAYSTYYPMSNDETGDPVYVAFDDPIEVQDGQRYLFCLQSFDPAISFGYDGSIDYDGNQGITAMPISPVYVDDTWYTGGWSGSSTPSIGLKVIDGTLLGLDDQTAVNGMAYPNPAVDVVTVSIESNGPANITVTDITGKLCLTQTIELTNGKAEVKIASLEAGIYVFNVELENGETSQFNVIKR
jgi:hypothetical protein